jgi:hypothetical protein
MRALGPGGVKTPARFHTDLFRSLFRALRPCRDGEIIEIFTPCGRSKNFTASVESGRSKVNPADPDLHDRGCL